MNQESIAILSIDELDRYHRFAMQLILEQELEEEGSSMECSDSEGEDLEDPMQMRFDENLWLDYNSSSDSDYESEQSEEVVECRFPYKMMVTREIPELVSELDGAYWNS